MSALSYEAVTAHRNEVAQRLVAELSKYGVASKIDGVMGACYVDLGDHKGFTLEVGRQRVKTDRPWPHGSNYTGRIVIAHQGFDEHVATEIIEPETGFDFGLVAAAIVKAARESSARVTAWEAKKAAALKDAAALEVAILEEFAEGVDSDPSVHVMISQAWNGEWVHRVEVEIGGLTAAQAREILRFARTAKGRAADR